MQSHRRGIYRIARRAVVDNRGLHPQAQVVGDVKHRQLCVHVGIDDRQRIHPQHHEETQVAPASVFVLSLPEDVLIPLFVGLCGDLHAQVQELVVTLRAGVIVHQVNIGLGVVLVHRVVPAHGIHTADESAIHERQFPVFAVIYLSPSGDDECEPQGPFRVRPPRRPVLFRLPFLAESRIDDDGEAVGLGEIQAVVVITVLSLGLLAPCCQQQEAERNQYMYSLTSHFLPLASFSVLDLVDDVHDMLQLVLVGKRDADLALALRRAGHLHLHLEEV